MKIFDTVHRFLFEHLDIRGAYVNLSEAWQAMVAGRNYQPRVEKILGELAATTVLIADNLKQKGRLTLQLTGNGPISLLLVDCNAALQIRGMARAKAFDDEKLINLFGDGQLQLILDTPLLREPYRSLVPLTGNTVPDVFEHYLTQSEQQETRLFLAADRERAAGLFLQKLPGADERDPDGWQRVESLAATVKESELLGLSVEDLLGRLFFEENLRLFDPKKISYFCPADREKVVQILRSFGRAELESMYADGKTIVVKDDICNHEYHFTPEDIAALLMSLSDSSSTLH